MLICSWYSDAPGTGVQAKVRPAGEELSAVGLRGAGRCAQARSKAPLADQRPWPASVVAATRHTYEACGTESGSV